MDKINTFFLAKYLQLKNKADRFMEEEDGTVVETVILIALAVILAGILLTVLAGDGKDGEGGIIGAMKEAIIGKFHEIFD